jgi:hypothetical protein
MLCQFRKNFFSEQSLAHAISICTFQNCENRGDIQIEALRYLFIHGKKYRKCPDLVKISLEMLKKFYAEKNVKCTRELVDIVSTFCPRYREAFLDFLREQDARVTQATQVAQVTRLAQAIPPKPSVKTVYTDSQNVHNSEINKSVIKSAQTLCASFWDVINLKEASETEKSEYKKTCLENIRKELATKHPEKLELVNSSIEYIKNNTAWFGETKITLEDTFLAVWLWISGHKDFPELENRLLEELKEMNGQCTTGHIARLVNIIQGFTEDEKLCIRISQQDRVKSIVYSYLTKELKTCQDSKVLDGILDLSPEYKQFILKKITERFPVPDSDVKQATNCFAKTKIFV